MYAKIETERLVFIRLNQTKLRYEEYIHLRDAVVNAGNTTNIGKLTILPSSYAGSLRPEYAQDAIADTESALSDTPRALISKTVTGNDGYPLYRRRSAEDRSQLVTIHMWNGDMEVDNRRKIGQRVYFTAANVQQTALNPPATTLTAFFTLYQNNPFAKTLLFWKCLLITYEMRIENHLNNANKENQLTDTWHIQTN
ncbi:unnamed protein product [Onchocerca ochengi]|uniref:Helitron_like_N domain-containing protein n=1 Tax=Onchocerca ochengi TaxID=42157 RepID=A0A182EKC1_ONCOC|nr:unnamed protein product [Onchocerca ochengi]